MKAGRILTGIMSAVFVALTCSAAVEAPAPQERILQIKRRISTRNTMVKLKDIIENTTVLSKQEGEYVVMKTPVEDDVSMSIIDVAYALQKFPSLLQSKLKGPRRVTIMRLSDMRYVDRAKKMILSYLRKNAPWKDWEVELMFDANDEIMISKVGSFARIEAMPYDTKGMIGIVDFRISFYDENDKLIKKMNLSPKILRRANAFVLRETRPQGYIVRQNDLKIVPVWIGGEKNRYITDKKDCVGKELAKEIIAGEFIRQPDMINPICARRGQMIWVTCASGGLSVKLGVLASQTGRLGDTIRAINRSTKKELNVELTGDRAAVYKL